MKINLLWKEVILFRIFKKLIKVKEVYVFKEIHCQNKCIVIFSKNLPKKKEAQFHALKTSMKLKNKEIMSLTWEIKIAWYLEIKEI